MDLRVPSMGVNSNDAAGCQPKGQQELFARLSQLSVVDKADMLDLLLAMPDALNDPVEMEAIIRTMAEILSQNTKRSDEKQVELVRLELPHCHEEAAGAPQWKRFVAGRVRQLRNDREWTQVQLADRSGISQSHICRIEGMRLSPTRKTIEALAIAFGVDVSEFDPSEDRKQ